MRKEDVINECLRVSRDGNENLTVLIPEQNIALSMEVGFDNLEQEDIDRGYSQYINFEGYDISKELKQKNGMEKLLAEEDFSGEGMREVRSGMFMLTDEDGEEAQENIARFVPEILEEADLLYDYGEKYPDVIPIGSTGERWEEIQAEKKERMHTAALLDKVTATQKNHILYMLSDGSAFSVESAAEASEEDWKNTKQRMKAEFSMHPEEVKKREVYALIHIDKSYHAAYMDARKNGEKPTQAFAEAKHKFVSDSMANSSTREAFFYGTDAAENGITDTIKASLVSSRLGIAWFMQASGQYETGQNVVNLQNLETDYNHGRNIFLTKTELRRQLMGGKSLENVLPSCEGQECDMFTTYDWPEKGDPVIYIPDYAENGIDKEKSFLSVEEVDNIISQCYSKSDFMKECFNNEKCAKDLWASCDWQHPDVEADLMVCTTDEEAKQSYGETWGEMKERYKKEKSEKGEEKHETGMEIPEL